jgi:hypothetical protein
MHRQQRVDDPSGHKDVLPGRAPCRAAAGRRPAHRVRLGIIATVLLVLVLVLLLASPALAFPDVPAGHPYETAINALSSEGIIGGYLNGDFGLNDAVKRAQFAKMIVGTLGITPNTSTVTRFTDLGDPDAKGYPHIYVQAAYDNGITYGTNLAQTLFDPWKYIRRDQVVSMIVRGVQHLFPTALEDPPAGTSSLFASVPEPHGANLRIAEYNGLLDGLIGLGPSWSVTANATRGEVAQVLYNVLNLADPALPAFADLKPAGPVGFTFTLNTPIIWAAEHEDDGIWPKTLPASTITGHVSMQTMAVGNGEITIKLTVDALTLPDNMKDAQDTMTEILPAYLLLSLDDQGTVIGISYKIKDKPEQALDQTMVAGVATFLTPVTSALMLPYSGQLGKPGDHLHIQKTYMSMNKKTMDVDTQGDYLSFASGVADLGFNLAVTSIDVPLRFDMRPFLPLLGYDKPSGTKPWIMDLNVGTTILANGEYKLDTTSGLPAGITLSSTMMLDAFIHQVPSQLLSVWPNSDFAHGWVDHAYLRAADHVSPMTVTFSMTKDAGQ